VRHQIPPAKLRQIELKTAMTVATPNAMRESSSKLKIIVER
jgi:hypothetical protein